MKLAEEGCALNVDVSSPNMTSDDASAEQNAYTKYKVMDAVSIFPLGKLASNSDGM